MSHIKDDLICEIIRLSQTNLLEKKKAEEGEGGDEQCILDWITKNAAGYRMKFQTRLGSCSATELGGILCELTRSGKDLGQLLDGNGLTELKTKPTH